jgi:hypothetical protein
MKTVNRQAIMVRPTALYFEWARALPGGMPDNTDCWTSVYLVDANDEESSDELLQKHFAEIFAEQLVLLFDFC